MKVAVWSSLCGWDGGVGEQIYRETTRSVIASSFGGFCALQ